MGTQAYSVIEQGKVDVLLQSSPRDRRVIFEEAAGISRFKLRKLEALRRLERVDQNLLRLSDIVEEVDSRLRTVRAQAGKARRYKEYTDRLQELRTQVGLVDWRRLTAAADGVREGSRQSWPPSATPWRPRPRRAKPGCWKPTAASASSTRRFARRKRGSPPTASGSPARNRRSSTSGRTAASWRRRSPAAAGNCWPWARGPTTWSRSSTTPRGPSGEAEEQQREIAQRVTEGERALTEVMARLDHLRGEHEQRRTAQLEQMRQAAGLASETSVLESQATAAEAVRQRSRDRIAELDRQLVALAADLDRLRRQRDELAAQADGQEGLLAAAKQDLVQSQQELAARQGELGGLQQRHSAAAERAAVLEELERRHEGLSAGVKEVLARAGSPQSGPFRDVCGLVADLFSVSVEVAPLVDVALGQAAQHVVAAASKELLDHLQGQSQRFGGRVGFFWLDAPSPATPRPEVDLEGRPGVLGRADRFVETQPRLRRPGAAAAGADLDRRETQPRPGFGPLGRPGLSFVTLAGELLEADGTLTVGPRQLAAGLISRRSQLRALKSQLAELEGKIDQGRTALADLQQRIAQQTATPGALRSRTPPGAGRPGRTAPEDLGRRRAPRAVRPAAGDAGGRVPRRRGAT